MILLLGGLFYVHRLIVLYANMIVESTKNDNFYLDMIIIDYIVVREEGIWWSKAIRNSIKEKLSFDEMIEHLVQKNVKFELISKEEAIDILRTSNYFIKLLAYRKNFEKNKYDKYVNLDFKLLQDIATIDMRLRYVVLQMCLDIEHTIKTKILTDITNDSSEDGYSIVTDYLASDNTPIDYYMKALNKESHYNYGLYVKHHKNTPIWVLFEVITFADS
ncbi:Abi family protein [Anaerobacillus sp. HL2]|nr:Abi family protein [Anaerobacillus sp. HL2]